MRPRATDEPEHSAVRTVALYTEEDVRRRVAELALQISRDSARDELIIVGLLKGAFVFMADLVRRLSVSCRCDFLAFQSYGAGTVSSGEARLVHDLTLPLAGADVLIVEDIVDTGITLRAAIERVRREHPRSLRTCTLLNKPSRREVKVALDYVAFTVPDRFIVGYGIDWKERFRALPYIAYVESA